MRSVFLNSAVPPYTLLYLKSKLSGLNAYRDLIQTIHAHPGAHIIQMHGIVAEGVARRIAG